MSNNKNNKNNKKQNLPYYMKNNTHDNMIEIDNKILEKVKDNPEKFNFHLENGGNVLLSIDSERPHIIYPKQFHAFTLACINIAKKVNPEIDYEKLFNRE